MMEAARIGSLGVRELHTFRERKILYMFWDRCQLDIQTQRSTLCIEPNIVTIAAMGSQNSGFSLSRNSTRS